MSSCRIWLVTGGAGFVGSNFVRHVLAAFPDDRVVVLDALTYAGRRANLADLESSPRLHFVHGDVCDIRLVVEQLSSWGVTRIVHLAAESHVDRSIESPDDFIRTNILGTYSMLKAAREVWCSNGEWRHGVHFHHVSTDEVYGALSANCVPRPERSPYAPNSPYSASKAASDHLVRAYVQTYGLCATTSHGSNNYGPFQRPDKLIPLAITNMLCGMAVPLYGDGRHVRDWVFVHDHCRAILAMIEGGHAGAVYNAGGGNQTRNLDVLAMLFEILKARLMDRDLATRFPKCRVAAQESVADAIAFVADRPGHDWRYALDCTKLSVELDFKLSESLSSGLKKTVDWYLENKDWWADFAPVPRAGKAEEKG